MPAYVVSALTITDRVAMARYAADTPPTLAGYGGEIFSSAAVAWTFSRGPGRGRDWAYSEFPSHAHALRWYESPQYAPLRELRNGASVDALVLVTAEGIKSSMPPHRWTRRSGALRQWA